MKSLSDRWGDAIERWVAVDPQRRGRVVIRVSVATLVGAGFVLGVIFSRLWQ